MSSKKILVVNDLHPIFLDKVRQNGFQVDYFPDITKEGIIKVISQYHGLVIRSKMFIDKAFVDQATNLEFVARAGAGIDNLDELALKEAGVLIFNAPEGNRDAVGEHAIGMLLMLFNNLHKGNGEVRDKIWDREGNRGVELGGKTVGVYGCGNTGKAFAKKLSGFDTQVIAFDKYKKLSKNDYVTQVDFEEFVSECDVVSIHVPLTDETNNYIDRKFFEAFKKKIYLINTARGKVVSLADLSWAIEQGKVLGACLDVLENEKLATYNVEEQEILEKLKQSGKVVFSPHVAGWTVESYKKISEVMSGKILKHYLPKDRLA